MGKTLFDDYEGFVEKFKRKKTTDDCYTPPIVYDAVVEYVDKYIMSLDGLTIRRPFKPDGDYQSEADEYGENDVVIDNPPFSILAKIRKFYNARKIKYFLFAPGLTLFENLRGDDVCTAIISSSNITYENGACVKTGFVTNFYPGDISVVCDGRLHRMLKAANARNLKGVELAKEIKAKNYPIEVCSAAILQKIVPYIEKWEVPRKSCLFIKSLDSMGGDKKIFGGGVLLSERAAAERVAAERVAAERAAERFELSSREKWIVSQLE